MAQCEAGARQHQSGMVRRDLDRDSGADRGPLAGAQPRLLQRVQIKAGVVVVRARGQQRPLIEAADVQAHR